MAWNRRRFNRLPLNLQAAIELAAPHHSSPAFGATIADVCTGGVGLITSAPLTVGAHVRLSFRGGSLSGVVAYCDQLGCRFASGIDIHLEAGALARLQWLATLSPLAHPSRKHPITLGRELMRQS